MLQTIDSTQVVKLKSRFFLSRFITYFSFLLIPVWIQKTVDLDRFFQTIITILYCTFMFGQWYLMGKEIDHRLKIYFRANSSIDRVIYRLITGSSFFIVLFNLISLLPWDLVKHFYWGVWVIIGLYYSWPTRGKIIEESMAGQLVEFKYLDTFEKSVLFLFAILFFVTIPEIPRFENIETLKLVFDPSEKIHPILWSFFKILFFPFFKNPKLYSLAWSLFFYLWGGALYFLSLYSLFRFLFSRRVSVLGIFAVISTWSLSKIINNDFASILTTTLPFVWVWTHIWSWRSATYRSGLLLGLITFLLVLIDRAFIVVYPVSLVLTCFIFLRKKTLWYRTQVAKYTLLGFSLTLLALLIDFKISMNFSSDFFQSWGKMLLVYLDQKAFFVLSIVGLLMSYLHTLKLDYKFLNSFRLDNDIIFELFSFMSLTFLLDFFFQVSSSTYLSMIWWMALFSLVPVEMVLQSVSKFRSRRNLIYFIYVLVCLLDSHFEGRVKIILKFFN